jgi:hypothetical protein
MTLYFTHIMYLCASHVSHRGYAMAQSYSAGSLYDGVAGILILRLHYGSGVESASSRYGYQCKGGRCVGLNTLPHSYADCWGNMRASNSWTPQGISKPVQELFYLTCFTEQREFFVSKLIDPFNGGPKILKRW